jgi:hypothetical protein
MQNMNKGGRPKKPRHIKEGQGTLTKSREIENYLVSEKLDILPAIPEGMKPEEEKFFIWACEEMLKTGTLSSQFLRSLERACFYWWIWVSCREIIRRDGATQKSNSGWNQKSGDFTVMNEAHKYLVEFDNEYGLNLVSSQKIRMPDVKKGNDYFD